MPFTKPELIDAVTKLFKDNDRTRIVSMLPETFVLKIPETLPYGGSFQGAGEFDRFFKSIYEDHSFWASFRTELSVGRVLDAGSYLVAPLRVTARAKSSGATITVENLWLFEVADGNFVRAQLYADTAAGRNVAGLGPQPEEAVLGGDVKAHNPAPLGDATVADESELFEQALWSGMKGGAALRVTSNHLLGVGLDQASASLRTPDTVVCLNQSGEVLPRVGREQTRRVLGRGLPGACRSSGHAGSVFLRMDLDSPILLRMISRPRARTVTANGLPFGVIEAGSGPLALCLHGFPDSAHSWRYLLPALAEAGFHAVAPFMRGYAPTGIPADGCYGLGALVADAVRLHDVLNGDDRAVLIGSDWGAETAYGAAAFAPDRWRRVVTIGVPPLALDTKIFADYDQLKRFFYLFFLKTPFAESVLAADDMTFLDRLWQDWCPGYDASEELRNVKQCLRGDGNLMAAIGYYRAGEPGLQLGAAGAYAAEEEALASTGPQPTLYLHGNRDGCIDLALVEDAESHLASGSRMEVVEEAGHFLHVEKPAEVNDRILAWVSA